MKRWAIIVIIVGAILMLTPTDTRSQTAYLLFDHPTDCTNPDGDDLGVGGTDSQTIEDQIGATLANLWVCVYEETGFYIGGEATSAGSAHAYGNIEIFDASTSLLLETLDSYDTWDIGACTSDGAGYVGGRLLDPGYYRIHAEADAGFSFTCDPNGYSHSSVAVAVLDDMCTDGTEALSSYEMVYPETNWTGSQVTSYDDLRVRYTYFLPSGESTTLVGAVNSVSATISASGSAAGATTVPVADSVSGPTANLTFTNQGEFRADLLSACIIAASASSTSTAPCPDCVAGRVAQIRQPNEALLFQGIPSEGLLPLPWENMANEWGNPLARLCMNFDFLWEIAQIALAFYNLVGTDSAWPIILSFLIILVGVSVLYKILIRPPDI